VKQNLPSVLQIALFVAVIVIAITACVPPPKSTPTTCPVTPDTTYSSNGHELHGKGADNIFLYMHFDGNTRTLRANQPEKMLIFLVNQSAVLPEQLQIRATNLATGANADFTPIRHNSDFGTDWGTNFIFPEPGCWELKIQEPSITGAIVITVK